MGAPGVVPGVVPQLQELLHVGVPGLQVDAGRPLAPPALVDGGHRGVEGLEPRHDAVGQPVGAPDQRPLGPHPVPGHADAARVLRELGDVGVALVDALQGVLGRVEQVAARHLGVGGAGVEQGRARRQIGQRRHQVVQRDGLVGIGAEPAGHPQEEVLGGLDHLPGLGVAQQVAVIHGAQAEELEVAVPPRVDGRVEVGGVGLDEGGGVGADQAQVGPAGDRLGEPGHGLVADLLVDVDRQHPGGQLGVVGLLDDEPGRGADAQFVKFAGGGPVGQGGDGAGADHHGVDAEQALGRSGHRVDDLVEIDRLEGAAALADPHRRRDFGGLIGLAYGRQPALSDRHEQPAPLVSHLAREKQITPVELHEWVIAS